MAAGRARGARAVPGGSLGEAGAVGRGPRAGSGASPSGYPESEHMDGVLISGTAAYELLGRVNRATQYWVSGLTFVVLFWLWSDAVAWAVGGSVVAAVLNKVLKLALNEARPETENGRRKKDPGMPSSHAQSLAFLSTYAALATGASGALGPWGAAAGAATVALGVFLAWLRVALGYHTWPQVAVGYGVGVANALLWQRLGAASVLPACATSPGVRAAVWALLWASVALVLARVGKKARQVLAKAR